MGLRGATRWSTCHTRVSSRPAVPSVVSSNRFKREMGEKINKSGSLKGNEGQKQKSRSVVGVENFHIMMHRRV